VTDLQHQRLAELSRELRLSDVPDLYSAIAQSVAAKAASFADFLEEVLRAERAAGPGPRNVRPGRQLPFGKKRSTASTSASQRVCRAGYMSLPDELTGLAFIERAENIVFLGPVARRQEASGDRARLSGHPKRAQGALHHGSRSADDDRAGATAGSLERGDAPHR
jgi:hypothetical protein